MTPPKGKPRSKGRTGGRWRAVHSRCRQRAARGEPCAWCGHQIDVSIPYPHPQSLAADHGTELVCGGAPYDVQPMHKACNEAKEQARVKAQRAARSHALLNTSRAW